MYSTVTGAPIDGAQLDAGYWIRNLREPVKFSTAVQRLLEDECDVFIEISPHPILLAAIEQNAGAGRSGLFLPSLRRQEPERAVMLESLGALYGHGYAVDWARLYPSGGNCVGLPSYAWERVRFWYPGSPTGRRPLGAGGHPWFEEHVASSADPGTHFWQGRTDPARVPWLMEYRVGGVARLPASAIVEMALAAGRTLFGAGGCRAEDLRLESHLVVSEAAPRTMQLMVSTSLPGSGSFRLASRDAEAQASARWTVHATGTIRTDPTEDGTSPLMMEPVVMADASPGEDHYEAMRRRGLDYGLSFQGIVETARRGPLTFVHVRATETVRRETDQYEIHPCLLDACLQAVVAALDGSTRGENTAYVPAGIGRVILHGPSGGSDLWCRVAFREEAQDGEVVADVVVADDTDQMLIEVTGVRLVPIARQSGDDLAHQGFEIVWRPKRRLAGARPRGSGRWVILADRRGVGEGLAAKLVARGSRCSLIFGRGAQVESGRNGTAIDPTSPGEYEALVASERTEPIEGVVHLWGLDTPPLDLAPQAAETITEALAIQGLVHLVRALVASGAARSPRIVLATAGTQEAAGGPGRLAIEQAPLWGVGAVIASEYPDLHCVRVDLSSEPTVEEIEGLAEECREPDGEGQIALRGPSRYVARLVRVLPSTTDHVEEHRSTPAGDTPFRLHTSATGALDGLHFRPLQRRAPGPGEVEIEVHAAGLNFRDVMSTLGSLPGHPDGIGTIGMECSGRVVAVGGMVETVSRGDEVVAIAFDSLSTHVVADARLVARKPIALSHQVAATLPIAFVAAWYALHTLAQMRPGERVLIHAATGGVGLAAVQLARKAGARVFATAGSAGKHEFLRTLGVEQVFDSRSLSFADNVRACTGGEGVDVVLNSLAGPAITAGLTALAPYGRFVELGMRDIHQNSLLGLGPFRRNLSYAALDLMQMCRERPGVVGALLADMMQRFSNGDLAPLPVRVFQIGEVKEAFRCMAEARHIGKIALSLLPEEARVAPLVGAPDTVCAEATYLITGGLGALGLTVARALVDAGARHVALIGRRAPGEAARRAIAELTRRGVDVVTMEADVTSPERMVEVLETLRREKPPLRGVIHAAGVLEDATLRRLTRDQIRKVMAPKAAGAFMLHVLTQGDPLDFFVLFSSASAFLGLGGQANYGGANAFLDALARHRHRLGQTALSIGWGPWSDIGLAAASDERGMRLEAMGLGSLTPRQGVEAFRQMLGSSHVHVAVMEFDATAWCAERGNDADVFLGELTAPTPATDGREGAQSLAEALRVAPATTRADMLLRHVREQVATVLRFAEPEAIDAARGFFTLGMDSLMAIELKNRLQASLERPLPSTVVFDRPSITQLAGYVGREILGWGASSIASGVPEPDSVDAEEIRRLSRHELQGLLAEELKQLKDLG
jgi:NADPH:quinone reductase-like Zn-dependent oxidoreductase/NADP-dependent 3-hydroxy acid dehydrogenase YdfG